MRRGGVAIAVVALARCAALRPARRPATSEAPRRPRQAGAARSTRPSQAAPIEFERADDAARVARRIETVLRRRTSRLIVVLERLVDGHNYSAIFRTCESLGVQHVWIIGPPEERFESRQSLKRAAQMERQKKFQAADVNRKSDDASVFPGSRKDRKRKRAGEAWRVDAALDAEHAAHGRGAARFLSIRDFDDVEGVLGALEDVPGCELWASDLGQAACVLEEGAPWLAEARLPDRVALVLSRRGNSADESRRRRGDVDILWRRVAATPRRRCGHFCSRPARVSGTRHRSHRRQQRAPERLRPPSLLADARLRGQPERRRGRGARAVHDSCITRRRRW